VVEESLEPFKESDDPDAAPEHHSHWACGWIEGYAIQVFRRRRITRVFRKYRGIAVRLANYPVLDEGVAAGQAVARRKGKRWGGSQKGWRWRMSDEQLVAIHAMRSAINPTSLLPPLRIAAAKTSGLFQKMFPRNSF